jgi:putative two-component system protein, hydrogenase maturation factor HypX/HoxX
VREVIETDTHLVVSTLTGDAAAGAVPFALAADYAPAREHVVLNPYYRRTPHVETGTRDGVHEQRRG